MKITTLFLVLLLALTGCGAPATNVSVFPFNASCGQAQTLDGKAFSTELVVYTMLEGTQPMYSDINAMIDSMIPLACEATVTAAGKITMSQLINDKPAFESYIVAELSKIAPPGIIVFKVRIQFMTGIPEFVS